MLPVAPGIKSAASDLNPPCCHYLYGECLATVSRLRVRVDEHCRISDDCEDFPMETMAKPWPAVWALVLGFFMIMIDTTIVYVATPAIMTGLHTDINSVIWVTSAYLLAYAVPLLITGRLGDRFGPKKLYLIGLVVFTLASVWCGLSGSI
jgi:Na+/melibiose symporter-like transporter